MQRNLERTLQALIDSGINSTTSTLWDNGVDFSFVSMKTIRADDASRPEEGDPGEVVDWHNVRTYSELGDAIDARAKIQSPNSAYSAKSEETDSQSTWDATSLRGSMRYTTAKSI
jgi:hypothetical protein